MGPLAPINISFPLRVERYTSATSSLSFPDINSGFYLDMYRRFTRSYQVGYASNAEGFAQYPWSNLQGNPASVLPATFPGASVDASALVSDIGKLIAESNSPSNSISRIVLTTFNANDYSKICDGSGFPFANQKIVRPTQPSDVPKSLRQVIDALSVLGRSYAFVYLDTIYIVFADSDLKTPTDPAIFQYIAKQTQPSP